MDVEKAFMGAKLMSYVGYLKTAEASFRVAVNLAFLIPGVHSEILK